MQVIMSQKLTGVEKLWLGSLRDNLTAAEVIDLVKTARDQRQLKRAFFDVVFKRNADTFKEVLAMEYKEVSDILEEVGWSDKYITKGLERGLEQGLEQGKVLVAINMLKDGLSPEYVSKYSEIPIEKLKELQRS
jgi:hypothetical protein